MSGLFIESVQAKQSTQLIVAASGKQQSAGAIRGNRNSKIYHLPKGCPSYSKIAPRNIVVFSSEEEAKAAGYRRAKNCR